MKKTKKKTNVPAYVNPEDGNEFKAMTEYFNEHKSSLKDPFYFLNKLSKTEHKKVSKQYHYKFVREFADLRPDLVEKDRDSGTEKQCTIFLFHKLVESELSKSKTK